MLWALGTCRLWVLETYILWSLGTHILRAWEIHILWALGSHILWTLGTYILLFGAQGVGPLGPAGHWNAPQRWEEASVEYNCCCTFNFQLLQLYF